MTILGSTVVITALGALAGFPFGLPTSGGLVGCFVGIVAGYATTYMRYRDV